MFRFRRGVAQLHYFARRERCGGWLLADLWWLMMTVLTDMYARNHNYSTAFSGDDWWQWQTDKYIDDDIEQKKKKKSQMCLINLFLENTGEDKVDNYLGMSVKVGEACISSISTKGYFVSILKDKVIIGCLSNQADHPKWPIRALSFSIEIKYSLKSIYSYVNPTLHRQSRSFLLKTKSSNLRTNIVLQFIATK